MTGRLPLIIIPAYIFLCLLLGGSGQAIVGGLFLHVAAVAIIAAALYLRHHATTPRPARPLWFLGGAMLLLFAVQLVPLPPSVWSELPGREIVVRGYSLLGMQLPWLPISLAPHRTLELAVSLFPALAILIGLLRFRETRQDWLVIALLTGVGAGLLLGVVQVSSGGHSWYLYRFSAFGTAAGFFANSNHMATLMLAAAPFLLALTLDRWRRSGAVRARSLLLFGALAYFAVVAAGILLNGSLAILLLSLPVALACALMTPGRPSGRRRRFLFIAAAIVPIGVIVGLAAQSAGVEGNWTSVETRTQNWEVGAKAVGDFWQVGSGIGTFPEIYRRYELPEEIGRTFINHAHNDYLELAIEAGAPGLLLITGFLMWWARATLRIWRAKDDTHYRRAATMASAVILLHSIVDYPLRTAALMAVFALSLALMVILPVKRVKEMPADIRPARHFTI